MAKTLQEWVNTDVSIIKDKSMKWLSEEHFFRDPNRALYADSSYFFAPADGIILYSKVVNAEESIIDIKGRSYSLKDAMRKEEYSQRSLVIGIFMTFYDVHINRIPYAGRLSYEELETISSHNLPMLAIEKSLVEALKINTQNAEYLFSNQRMLNTIFSIELQQKYYILQIADYDVDCITPFRLKQNKHFAQGQRFSQIRYGSQVDVIIPLSENFEYLPLLQSGMHVEAGVDAIVKILKKQS
ncbi:MAG: phosphatidylserine decarboxylase [Sulfurimonas sp.]|nr:phosphatidylserine decarboxylase [Sulfurimonas sp.]MBU1216627.1 phosphatidylserine decarboxylase [bacterium]MBU1433636.1 phosphatidylserine decarboxylase [bacterium]MBU1503183.1 phosphatidylserine decarboxylase [bacterium]MBU3938488.1 phosphatidylserine decarboxylase [bacterium]